MTKSSPDSSFLPPNSSPDDLVWGYAAIGKRIGRSAEQTRYLVHHRLLGDAVKKLGRKTVVGHVPRLLGVVGLLES
jgi:hypothetical protein